MKDKELKRLNAELEILIGQNQELLDKVRALRAKFSRKPRRRKPAAGRKK
jgi:hypothetical protein